MNEVVRSAVIGRDILVFVASVAMDSLVFVYVLLCCLDIVDPLTRRLARPRLAWSGVVAIGVLVYLSYGILLRRYLLEDRQLCAYSLTLVVVLVLSKSWQQEVDVSVAWCRLVVSTALVALPLISSAPDRLLAMTALSLPAAFIAVRLGVSIGIIPMKIVTGLQVHSAALFVRPHEVK